MKLVEVMFLDHVSGDTRPMLCSAVGYVVEETKDYLGLAWWTVMTDCKQTEMENREVFSILKSTIKKKRVLK